MIFVKRVVTLLMILTLLLSACGGPPPPAAETTTAADSANVVKVSTVDEFLAAIVPGNTIELAPGEYRLEEAADYGNAQSRYYTWEDLGLGDYGLQIQYVNGLTIRGAG